MLSVLFLKIDLPCPWGLALPLSLWLGLKPTCSSNTMHSLIIKIVYNYFLFKGVPGARRSPPWSTWTPQLPWRQGRRSPPSPGQTHTSTRHTASYNNHTRWQHSRAQQETFQKSFKTTLYKKDPGML